MISATEIQTPRPNKRIELLTLGDELLLGLATNSHLTFIGAELARRGAMLQRNVSVSDDAAVIARQFAECWRTADVVITTGGLGPTCDDRTREAVAQVLGQRLVHDDAAERALRERFARLGRPMTPNNLKQAQRPERAEILHNPNGTAPGLWVEQDGKVLCMLPGPPNEMRPMLTSQVLPRLAHLGFLTATEAYVQMRTIGIGESMLETKLQTIFDKYGANGGAGGGALNVAYCAHLGAVDCRLDSPDGRYTLEQLGAIARECGELLGDDLMCHGHAELPQIVANLLLKDGKLLAVAEDATGGLLANCFNEIADTARSFAGGATCHTNEAKMQLADVPEEFLMQHTGVSEENAVAMAVGIAERLGADYALAVTGFENDALRTRDSKTSSQNEANGGALYIGLHTPRGDWARMANYPGQRFAARERTINLALDWLRRELLHANDTPDTRPPVTDARMHAHHMRHATHTQLHAPTISRKDGKASK